MSLRRILNGPQLASDQIGKNALITPVKPVITIPHSFRIPQSDATKTDNAIRLLCPLFPLLRPLYPQKRTLFGVGVSSAYDP
jgi:hypothetical protein